MKPLVTVLNKRPQTRPPICPWFIDNPDDPPRHAGK
jgi:hypothetical protein